jgi:glycosyltransferase involved in cell wall biosynthesis
VSGSTEVSACMIIRNAAATLAACLRTVIPVCDELIAVDTGSDDDSRAIAQSFGARVLSAPWKEDFSAARNVYLEQARCSWVLCLDADEVLLGVSRSDLLPWLARGTSTAFVFSIRNYFRKNDFPEPILPGRFRAEVLPGIGCMITKTVRLFPRSREVRYSYPVHESLVPALKRGGFRIRHCTIPIHHWGYFCGKQELNAKAALYRKLGLRKIAQYPEYFLGYLELGKVYLHEGLLEDAERMFSRSIRLRPNCSEAQCFRALTLLREGRYVECRRQLHSTLRQIRRCPAAIRLLDILERADKTVKERSWQGTGDGHLL